MVAGPRYALALACALLTSSLTWGEMREANSGADNAAVTPHASSSWNLRDVPLDVLAGAAILKSNVGVALALRGPLVSNVRWELGGILPHFVSGYANDQVVAVAGANTETDSAEVHQFGEAHAVGLYPLWQRPREARQLGYTLDAGAGISIAFVDDYINDQVTGVKNYQTLYHNNEVKVGPRIQLGGAVSLSERLSLRLDLAWVDYGNNSGLNTHTFDLGFGGVVISPMLQVRI